MRCSHFYVRQFDYYHNLRIEHSLIVVVSLFVATSLNPSHDTTIAVSAFETNSQRRGQYVFQEAASEEALREARSRTQRIWADLRELEPTWRESLIDARTVSLPNTIWHYAKIIFRTLFMNAPSQHTSKENAKLSPRLQEAVDGLGQSAPFDSDAVFLLAEMNFYGNFSHPRRPKQALDLYAELAARDGNATAYHMMGVLHATGLGGAIEIDQAAAQLYYTFAAEQGETRAQMTLAHRFHAGIGTAKMCDRSVEYYKRVADKAMDWWLSGPPGGHMITRDAHRWVEEAGGAYGEGASWTSSGPFASTLR